MIGTARTSVALAVCLLFIACGGGGGGSPSAPAVTAPTITAQPAAVTVTEGDVAGFSVSATGTAPLAFQWRRNGQPIAGATQNTLTLSAAAFYDSGDRFSVVVSNSAGQVTSTEAGLTVSVRPKLALCGTAFVLRSDGTLWSWGANTLGQLGRGLADFSARVTTPAPIATLSDVVNVACGASFALALLRDGTVRAWGDNAYGQLADGSRSPRSSPVVVAGVTNVVSIAAGQFGAYALQRDGTLWRWGSVEGQLPPPAASAPVSGPQTVPVPEPIAKIAGGYGPSKDALLLVGRSGQLYFFGEDRRVDQSADPPAPVTAMPGFTDVVDIGVGVGASSFLRADGSVWIWGSGQGGQFGNGRTGGAEFASQPQRVPGLPAIRTLSHVGGHLLAVDRDSRIWSWGDGNFGALGRATAADSDQATPARIQALPDVDVAVAGRVAGSIAMSRDGRVWVWGYNFYGVLGVPYPQTVSDAVPRVINGVVGR